MLKIDKTIAASSRKRALAASTKAFLLFAAAALPLVSAQAQTVTYADPIVITKGGTYTGNYRSDVSGRPAVLVNTNEPVVLDGCNLVGAGNLIQAGRGADLTVRNCRGQGLAPTVNNQPSGHFVDAYQSQSLVIEHNFFSGTSGIVVNRWSGAGSGPTLTVRYNQALNIDGRWRNGGGSRSSFLILNTVQHLPGVEIAYNEVLNTPDQSLVEDNINFYNSSGTAGSPAHVHDNFVRGAYPFPATGTTFTGTGITTDGDAQTAGEATAFVEADHNQFVSIGNSAMNIASGHDIYYHDNRAVTSGYLPNGQRFNTSFCGLGVFNYYQQPSGVFYNNRVAANTVGVVRWGGSSPFPDRQDEAPDACATCQGTIHLPAPIAAVTEAAEWTLWQAKLQQNGVVVGPLGAAAAPAPAVPPAAVASQVTNPGFEADGGPVRSPIGWQTWTGGLTSAGVDYTEAYGGAYSGTYHGTHYSILPYEVYTYQVVSGLANGTYAFSAWVKSSGGQAAAQMRASNYGGGVQTADLATTPGGVAAPGWVLLTVANIAVTNGQCEIGFYSKASSNQAIYFDDVTLAPQQAAGPNVAPTVALAAASSTVLGQAVALSATAADADGTVAKVEFFNGTTKLGEAAAAPYQLSWTPAAAGTYALTAVATDNAGASTTSAAVVVVVAASTTPAGTGANLVANPGFEAGGQPAGAPTGWQTATGHNTSDNADYTEAYAGAHAGLYHGTQYESNKYEVYTYQVVQGLPTGNYTLRVWVKSSGGQPRAELRVSNYGGDMRLSSLSTNMNDWTLVQIPNISVTSGQAEIGFYSDAKGGQWLYYDDVELVLQGGASATSAAAGMGASAFAAGPTLFPNPADGQVTVSVNFAQATAVTLVITDLQGTPVARSQQQAAAGDNQFALDTSRLPSGIYALQIQSNQPTLVQRLEVKH